MLRSVRRLLADMDAYSARCQRYVDGKTYLAYSNDERLRLAVERCLGIVGEALIQAVRIDETLLQGMPDAVRIMNLRHRLVHSYYNIDDAIIWSVIGDYLPGLQREVTYLISRLPNEESAL